MVKYLTNAFSLNMVSPPSTIVLDIDELNQTEFCNELKYDEVKNAIGHKSTVELINSLCNTNFDANRIQIQLINGDILLIPQISIRLEEGKTLNINEIKDLLNKGLIKFLKVKVYYV